MIRYLTPLALLLAAVPAPAATPAPIAAALANPARTAEDKARDRYRHPGETLAFFGVAPGQTVIEFQPAGGWYARILVPLLARSGTYVGVGSSRPGADERDRAMLAKIPGGDKAKRHAFDPATASFGVPDGSADRVLTFRNMHNLVMSGKEAAAGEQAGRAFFQAAFKALKPGGVLGVVDHRLPESADTARERSSGYLKRSTIERFARAAGFRPDGASEINANPKDTHDWPKGVWTLPPSLDLGEQDRAKYLAVGESDRMTLRFVKPRA